MSGAEFVGKGMEHVVVVPEGMNCVLKDHDPRVFDPETFEISTSQQNCCSST
jgi:hypothetical protein